MFCTKCGSEIDNNAKFCGICGESQRPQPVSQNFQPQQVQQFTPYQPPRKKTLKVWQVVLIVIGGITIIGFIGNLIGNSSEYGTNQETTNNAVVITTDDAIDTTESAPSTTEKSDDDDFRHYVYAVLRYHEDLENGKLSEAEASGSLTGFQVNLALYKINYGSTSLEYRVYYYALYGESEYEQEFGYNKDYMNDVKDYVADYYN